jgi:lysophospholipase L1-like esterase
MRVLLFGDSITFGAWDSQGGWADRLKRFYNAEYQRVVETDNPNPHQILNLGIGGDTSRNLLARFEHEYKARASANWPPVFVIAVGVNDTKVPRGGGANLVPIDEYRANMRAIVQLAKKYSDKILLVGLFPLRDEELPFKDVVFRQDTVEQYDAVIDEVSKEFSVPKVEVLQVIAAQHDYKSLFFADGLHPNDAGHGRIYDLIKPAVELLIRES